jgi:glycerol-3-phosphate dehydrogenase (NAD(P)+)
VKEKTTIAIIGAGMWGTALGSLLMKNGHPLFVWSRRSPEKLEDIVGRGDAIVSAVSISGVRPTIAALKTLDIPPDRIIVTTTKGLDPISNGTPFQLWQAAFPHNPLVVLSGPNLSKEIARGLPAATVVASFERSSAEIVQLLFASDSFRVYVNNDPLGTELGGTLKNVMAIASGVCDGLALGTNAKSALLTRALPEMIRVGTTLGGKRDTFFGLSGLGDLLATCNSVLSRNYQVGYQLSQGKSLENILRDLEGTAEGVNTTEVLVSIAKLHSLYIPITHQVHRLLTGEISPETAVKALMQRDLKAESIDSEREALLSVEINEHSPPVKS